MDRKTHIEVCVRIRPLVVSKESSTSYLRQHLPNGNRARSRGAGTPRPNKLATPRGRRSAPSTPRSSPRSTFGKSADDDDNNSAIDDSNDSSAWDVSPILNAQGHTDTAVQHGQSAMTGRTTSYTLDHVYGPASTTRDLYDKSVLGLVHAAMDGYHASVLAYGQTSTGKTHTMTGTASQPGLIPLAIHECFDYLRRQTAPREYLLRLSYMEVYKEHIRDLLQPTTQQHHHQQPIRLFDSTEGLVIKGLKEEVVTSPEEVLTLLAEGESRRQVGATSMNAHSSRSHTIVRLWIESRALPDNLHAQQPHAAQRTKSTSSTTSSLASSSRIGGNSLRVSSLSLVDLAGSESVRLTGNNDRRQEGHYINQSLMTLGKVVYALSEMEDKKEASTPSSRRNQTKHIPYRDSKLTRLLQPSLSGNAQVVLVCCISPLTNHLEESHSTFKFAMRAKKIPQKATIQEETPDERSLLQSYRDEIEDLRKQLLEAKQNKPPANPAADLLAAASFASTDGPLVEDVVSEDEIQELVTSIQTMEKLILKSKPLSPVNASLNSQVPKQSAEDLLDSMLADDDWDDNGDDEEDLIALATTKSEASKQSSTASMSKQSGTSNSLQTPVRATDSLQQEEDSRDLEIELSRIQGLLGSVLKKRKQQSSLNSTANASEVLELRAQLEQHEAASTIRKADSSFLQKQLEEKEDLLAEISKLLEQMEQRQNTLEKDNAKLRRQLVAYQDTFGDLEEDS